MKTVHILGIPVHAVTLEEALDKIESFVGSSKPHQLTTVNPEFILEAQRNSSFAKVLKEADLSLADGSGIVWAARYCNTSLPERIPGADLVNEIARVAEKNDWKFYLVGAGKGVAEQAAKKLNELYPKLLIVGAEEGMPYDPNIPRDQFNEDKADDLTKRITRANPDVLLVAFGAPKQDLFIARYKDKLKVPVMIGVGGTFDFLAERVKRAPVLFRILWLEWLWRLIQEPKRFNRIIRAVIVFPWKVIASKKPPRP